MKWEEYKFHKPEWNYRELLGYDKMTEDEMYNVHSIGKPTFEVRL